MNNCLPSNRGSSADFTSLAIEGKSFKGFAFLLRIPSFLKHFGLNFIQAFLHIIPSPGGLAATLSPFAPRSLRGQKRFPQLNG